MSDTPPLPPEGPEGSVPPPSMPGQPAAGQPASGPAPDQPGPGGPGQMPPAYIPAPYPADLTIDYQDRELNRTTTFFRFFTAIPILIIAGLLVPSYFTFGDEFVWTSGAVGLIVAPTALMIIFREKYPRWWFDFNEQLFSFMYRVGVYLLLIDDRYPSTDERQSVHVKLEYPDVQRDLSRFMPIIKWLLAIPHFFILFFLWIGVFFGTIYAWFMILFTGRYPADIFSLVVGVLRWQLRVYAYCALLVTDEYPPFRLES